MVPRSVLTFRPHRFLILLRALRARARFARVKVRKTTLTDVASRGEGGRGPQGPALRFRTLQDRDQRLRGDYDTACAGLFGGVGYDDLRGGWEEYKRENQGRDVCG